MPPIRVLVVEDSATVRELLCRTLESAPDMELVAAAEDGQAAIDLCRQLRPDVVSMDMMLPRLNGLAATESIMAYCPTPILIVSSSFNRAEVFHTYDALAAGAVDVLEKPDGNEAPEEWGRRFLSAIRVVSRIRVITHLKGRAGVASAKAHPPLSLNHNRHGPRVIAVGASTGGPAAAVQLFGSLPTSVDAPVLFVIHLNPQFGRSFADWLDTQTPWRARFARDGEPLSATGATIILAPPEVHMMVEAGCIRLRDGPERFSCKPSVDVLFESVAAHCGPGAAAALLTGMGRDGAAGLLAIRQSGGTTIAQDEATSVVYGMPREAALLGAAERILPLSEIGPALAEFTRAGTLVR